MSKPRERLRELLATPGCKVAAPVFDPLSARISEMVGWDICKISGSVGKFAGYCVPDRVRMTNMSDLADTCRRVTRVIDIPLVIDADDGGGNALTLRRTIRDLEAAGVAAIEIEDNEVPPHFFEDGRHSLMLSKDEQVAKLKAAVEIRQDPSMVLIGRTACMTQLPFDEALDRIQAYSRTGVDALMVVDLEEIADPRATIEAVQSKSELPIVLGHLSDELVNNKEWLAANRVVLRYVSLASYRCAVLAIYDALKYQLDGREGDDLPGAPPEIRNDLIRDSMLREWDKLYSAT